MPLFIINEDITEVKCDAIVNPTNNSMVGRGESVDGKIHRIAGPALDRECILLGGCETGKAKLTQGYNLPCKYVIHTAVPVWRGGTYRENEFLASCYRESLRLCKRRKIKSVAFPIMASGSNGYPKEDAFAVAVREIRAYLENDEMRIYLVVYDPAAVVLGEKLKKEVAAFVRRGAIPTAAAHADLNETIKEYLKGAGETFTECLYRFIDEKGMTDPACYKRANIDRKHFSKLRSGKSKPKKTTVFALALALELDLSDTETLLRSAGYAFSRSDALDLIVEYFIQSGKYDIYEINFTLNAFGQPILGMNENVAW